MIDVLGCWVMGVSQWEGECCRPDYLTVVQTALSRDVSIVIVFFYIRIVYR